MRSASALFIAAYTAAGYYARAGTRVAALRLTGVLLFAAFVAFVASVVLIGAGGLIIAAGGSLRPAGAALIGLGVLILLLAVISVASYDAS